jgi:hypothetical protein
MTQLNLTVKFWLIKCLILTVIGKQRGFWSLPGLFLDSEELLEVQLWYGMVPSSPPGGRKETLFQKIKKFWNNAPPTPGAPFCNTASRSIDFVIWLVF